MNCPLKQNIAIISSDSMDEQNLAAVRLTHRGHDWLILNPTISLWQRLLLIAEAVTDPDERERLVYGLPCTCTVGVDTLPIVGAVIEMPEMAHAAYG